MFKIVMNYFAANHCAELIGTIADIIVVITYSVHGEKKMRILDILGSFVGMFYDYYVNAMYFFILDIALILINLYYLLLAKI
jgi:hypothetical protein